MEATQTVLFAGISQKECFALARAACFRQRADCGQTVFSGPRFVVRVGSPLSRSAMIEPMHRGDRTSSSSCVKPPAHPIRFVSPAGRLATTDTIWKSAILVALLREAFLDGRFSFGEGFVSFPDILGTGPGQPIDLSHFRDAKKCFFLGKRSKKLKRR